MKIFVISLLYVLLFKMYPFLGVQFDQQLSLYVVNTSYGKLLSGPTTSSFGLCQGKQLRYSLLSMRGRFSDFTVPSLLWMTPPERNLGGDIRRGNTALAGSLSVRRNVFCLQNLYFKWGIAEVLGRKSLVRLCRCKKTKHAGIIRSSQCVNNETQRRRYNCTGFKPS